MAKMCLLKFDWIQMFFWTWKHNIKKTIKFSYIYIVQNYLLLLCRIKLATSLLTHERKVNMCNELWLGGASNVFKYLAISRSKVDFVVLHTTCCLQLNLENLKHKCSTTVIIYLSIPGGYSSEVSQCCNSAYGHHLVPNWWAR
jgi:hypothetical protein